MVTYVRTSVLTLILHGQQLHMLYTYTHDIYKHVNHLNTPIMRHWYVLLNTTAIFAQFVAHHT